jgi:hypothetical protein
MRFAFWRREKRPDPFEEIDKFLSDWYDDLEREGLLSHEKKLQLLKFAGVTQTQQK